MLSVLMPTVSAVLTVSTVVVLVVVVVEVVVEIVVVVVWFTSRRWMIRPSRISER